MTKVDSSFKLIDGDKSYILNDFLNGKLQKIDNELLAKVNDFILEWFNGETHIVQQTSGSTGEPKIIKLLKKHMVASSLATIQKLDLKPNDCLLLAINPAYIGGKMMIIRALVGGMTIVLGNVSAQPLATTKAIIPIDFFSFVPYQLLQMLLSSDTNGEIEELNRAKAIILGGAPVNERLHQLIKERISCKVYSTYGMTETVSHIALKLLNTTGESSYFEALSGVKFSTNSNNCLVIHAPHITGTEGLVTNDIVRLVDENKFEWLGRYDFMINSGGIKIPAEQLEKEIQHLLREHQLQNQIVVFGLEDEALGEKVALLIESEDAIEGLNDILRKLPKYHIPRDVFYISNLIYSESDKLDRKASIAAALQ